MLWQVDKAKASSFDLKRQVEEDYRVEMADRTSSSVFAKGGCESYYVATTEGGKKVSPTNWPGSVSQYKKRTRVCHLHRDYDLTTTSSTGTTRPQ